MKIAVTATGPRLTDQVEARFGRCPYFLIIDTDTMEFETLENPNVALGGGAGIQSAQLMSEKGVQVVLTGNCGPNAFRTFGAAGINVIVGVSGPVCDAVEKFKTGALSAAPEANVASHFGVGQGGSPAQGAPSMTGGGIGPGGAGMGRGGGMGGGRGGGMGGGRGGGMGGGGGGGMGGGRGGGMGGGRGGGMGGGRGGGMGGGRGGGMGGGRGGGMGQGAGMGTGGMMNVPPPAPYPGAPAVPQQPGAAATPEEELQVLKGQAQAMNDQLGAINARIEQLQQGDKVSGLVAVVDSEKCTGCRRCEEACPVGAISVGEFAQIDREKCTGCALCVAECPQDALSLHKA